MTIVATVAACGHPSGFQSSQPSRIELTGRSIAVIGDLQQTTELVRFVRRREDTAAEQGRLLADLGERIDAFAALVIVGDLVYSARSQRDWAHLDSLIAPLAERLPILPAIGNHDYPCWLVQFCRTARMADGMQQRFPWLEPGRAYAIPADDLLLLFLDTESRLDEQAAWLGAQLDAAERAYSAALVFFHRPPFSHSIERSAKGDTGVQRTIVPVLRNSPLTTIVVSGHIHGFEHIVHDGVHFITSGGGGGPRVAMPETGALDQYRGPECRDADRSITRRPFNYLVVTPAANLLTIHVRGFCDRDDPIEVLHSIEIEL